MAAAVAGIPGGVRLKSGADSTASGAGAGMGVERTVVADSSKVLRRRMGECILVCRAGARDEEGRLPELGA